MVIPTLISYSTNLFVIAIRDALYTTQPLELLNALGFENLKNDRTLNVEVNTGDGASLMPVDYDGGDNRQFDANDRNPNALVESGAQMNLDGSEGQVFEIL